MEDRGQEKMHVDVAGTPECEEHDKWPDSYSKLQGVGGQGGGGRAGCGGTTEEEEAEQKVNLKFRARMERWVKYNTYFRPYLGPY